MEKETKHQNNHPSSFASQVDARENLFWFVKSLYKSGVSKDVAMNNFELAYGLGGVHAKEAHDIVGQKVYSHMVEFVYRNMKHY